jgi:hypothetical protein
MRSGAALLLVSFLTAMSGCVATHLPEAEIALDPSSTQLEGWFSARGEWTLFPAEDFKNYSPYNKEENKKCVSLINATGSVRSEYQALDGKKVVVVGHAAKYDTLPNGNSTSDRLLSKKYFKNEAVQNFCLRDLVFVASGIRRKI